LFVYKMYVLCSTIFYGKQAQMYDKLTSGKFMSLFFTVSGETLANAMVDAVESLRRLYGKNSSRFLGKNIFLVDCKCVYVFSLQNVI